MFSKKNYPQDRYSTRATGPRYSVTHPDVVKYINKATKQFKHFREDLRDRSVDRPIKKAAEYFIKAIESCVSDTDQAYCRRKYATTIIRDEGEPLAYAKASEHLLLAIRLYEDFLEQGGDNRQVIIMELQQAYVLLGSVGLKLKQGDTLRKAVDQLPALLEECPNPLYKIDLGVYAYHLYLSENKAVEAKKWVQEVLDSNPTPTDHRHMAKVNLLMMISNPHLTSDATYFENEVRSHFWVAFDAHKAALIQALKQARKTAHIHKALLDDFRIMLYVKIVQRLHHIKTEDNLLDETICNYMKRQICKVYPPGKTPLAHNVAEMMKQYIDEIRSTGRMTLAYQLTDNLAPGMDISPEQCDELFPDLDQLVLPLPESGGLVAPRPVHPGRFGVFNDADRPPRNRYYSRAASSSTSPQ